MLGYQVFSQLQSLYGREGAQTITGTVNNRIVFNTPDAETASHCSDNLGLSESMERTNSITVGAHEARDGVAFQQNRTERAIVTASEIQSLPQFEAYVRFAYNAPTAKVIFQPIDVESTEVALKPYLGGKFHFGILDNDPDNPSERSKYGPALSPQEIADLDDDSDIGEQFYLWAARNFRCEAEMWFQHRNKPSSDITPFWPHFAQQFKAGVDPTKIKPIILNTDRMMSNRGPEAHDWNTAPVAPWDRVHIALPKIPHDPHLHTTVVVDDPTLGNGTIVLGDRSQASVIKAQKRLKGNDLKRARVGTASLEAVGSAAELWAFHDGIPSETINPASSVSYGRGHVKTLENASRVDGDA